MQEFLEKENSKINLEGDKLCKMILSKDMLHE